MKKYKTTLKGLNDQQLALLDYDFWDFRQFALFMGSGNRNFCSTKKRNDPTFPKHDHIQNNRLQMWKVAEAIVWAEDYLSRPSKCNLGLKYNMSAPLITMRSISENLKRRMKDAKIESASKLGYYPLLMQTSSPHASIFYINCLSEVGTVVRIRPEWGNN